VTNLFRNEWRKHCRRKAITAKHYKEIYDSAKCSYYSNDPLDLLILKERQEAVWTSFKLLDAIQKFLLIENNVKKRPLTVLSKQLNYPYEYTRKRYHEACKQFSKYFHMYYHSPND